MWLLMLPAAWPCSPYEAWEITAVESDDDCLVLQQDGNGEEIGNGGVDLTNHCGDGVLYMGGTLDGRSIELLDGDTYSDELQEASGTSAWLLVTDAQDIVLSVAYTYYYEEPSAGACGDGGCSSLGGSAERGWPVLAFFGLIAVGLRKR